MGKVRNLIPPRPSASKGGGNNAGLYCTITAYQGGQEGPSGDVYVLKMPKEISDNFSADWQQEELSADFLNRLINNLRTGNATFGNSATDAGVEIMEQLGLGGAGQFGMAGGENGTTVGGQARNKGVALLFRNPNLKQYQVSWDFIPVNSKDAEGVNEFIKDMRKFMHPTSNGQLFSYPYLFDVKIFAVGKVIFASKAAALTNLTINPFGSGLPSFHSDGNAVHTSVTLEFQEIRPKQASDIEEMYKP
jgi:hypothetical protein